MHYTTAYNRSNLQVVHPQLDQSIGEQRVGRKRFEVRKNEESSGLSYGYGLNHMQKKSYSQDSQPVSYPDYSPSVYKPSPPKQPDYTRPEPIYRDQATNFSQKAQIPPNYEENPPEPNKNIYEPDPQYPDNYDRYPPNPYENPGYKDFKYSQQYEDPESMQKYSADPAKNPYNEDTNEKNKQNMPEEPKKVEYFDEIEKLKEELRRKEEELAMYSQTLNKTPPLPNDSQEAMYSRINKAMFDKQRTEEQRKINSSTLDYQLNEKNRMKMIVQQERDREQAIRLEMLRKLKEDEALERMERMKRAKEYREQLEVQNLVKSNLNNQEKNFYRNDIPKPFEVPPSSYNPEPYVRSNNSSNNLSYTPGSGKFTKKTPKTICYNPITGVLKDTSQYVYGSFPSYNIKDPSITYLKNQSNIPELAAHPAFHQHLFTKNHPKVVPSFPITGNAGVGPQEFNKDVDGEGYRPNDKHMMEYGQLMMQNKNPTYN
jgi:hypothetical protein